jgi:hypothetical protein
MKSRQPDPLDFINGYLTRTYQHVPAPSVDENEECIAFLEKTVPEDDYTRLGALLALEKISFFNVRGGGVTRLGLFPTSLIFSNFISLIPDFYVWLFVYYLQESLEMLKEKHFEPQHFEIQLPLRNLNKQKCYQAHIKIYCLNREAGNHTPRRLIVIVELSSAMWSIQDAPMISRGEFFHPTFSEKADEWNIILRERVKNVIFNDTNVHLGISPKEGQILEQLARGFTKQEITKSLKLKSEQTYDSHTRNICKAMKALVGSKNTARDYAQYFKRILDLGRK